MNEERMPRWKERLDTFSAALARLADVVALQYERKLNEYECDSLIKRFEFSYEMAWKLMMSFEKENGIEGILGSKDVVRHAQAMQLIDNGEAWMDMIDARNKTSHVYDEQMANDVADDIIKTYYPLLQELQDKMTSVCTD
jgi:nucleotidyltransferase substrate binding protein (TIGR01987 family)